MLLGRCGRFPALRESLAWCFRASSSTPEARNRGPWMFSVSGYHFLPSASQTFLPSSPWHEPCCFVSLWVDTRAADGQQGDAWSWSPSLVSLPGSTVYLRVCFLAPQGLGFPQSPRGTPLCGVARREGRLRENRRRAWAQAWVLRRCCSGVKGRKKLLPLPQG